MQIGKDFLYRCKNFVYNQDFEKVFEKSDDAL